MASLLLSLPHQSGGVLTKRNLMLYGLLGLSVLLIGFIYLGDALNIITVAPSIMSYIHQILQYSNESRGSSSLFLKDGLIDANIFFLHFPKAGTTFAHTVLYTQTNCQHLVGSSKQAAMCCIHTTLEKCVERYNLSSTDHQCCKNVGG